MLNTAIHSQILQQIFREYPLEKKKMYLTVNMYKLIPDASSTVCLLKARHWINRCDRSLQTKAQIDIKIEE